MSKTDAEIINEVVGNLIEKVAAEAENDTTNTNESETLIELVDEVESETESESYDSGDFEVNQTGGAPIQILGTPHYGSAGGHYANHFKTVTLKVRLGKSLTTSPNSAEEFAELVKDMVERYRPNRTTASTKAGITFMSPELNEGEATGLPFTLLREIEPRKIVKSMELMNQSNRSPLEVQSRELQILLKFLTPPNGSGKKRLRTKDILEKSLFEKRRRINDDEDDVEALLGAAGFIDDAAEDDEEEEDSDFDLDVEDTMEERTRERSNIMKNDVVFNCLPHAIFQSHMYHESKNGETSDSRRKAAKLYRLSLSKSSLSSNRSASVHTAIGEMKTKAGIQKTKDFDILDVEKIQNTVYAGTHQIIVVVQDQRTPFFAGPFVGSDRVLPIFLESNADGSGHFSGVRKLPALLNAKYYCALCDVRYATIGLHYKCPLRHYTCGSTDCPVSPDDLEYSCLKCEQVFRSKRCLENHLLKGSKQGKSRCDYSKKCRKCGDVYFTNKTKVAAKHECNSTYCKRCEKRVPKDHYCTLQESKKKEAKLTRKRIFFDFESREDEDTGLQVPVLFIALRCCPSCSHIIPEEKLQAEEQLTCDNCSPEGRYKLIECITDETRFVNVAEEATEWIFSKQNRGCVAIAHNAGGYDAQFLLKSLVASTKAAPRVTSAGTKIIFIQHKGVKIIDSLKYLTMSLAAVGKAFEIPVAKGDFPVKFIKPENYDYEGVVPEDKFYNMKNKSTDAKKKLAEYLLELRAKNYVFNFYDEIVKYCHSDVYILAKALTAFEKDFENLTNVCLFEESTTAASAAVKVFQRSHLNCLNPIVLDARPAVSMKCSVVSQKFMAWFGEVENVQVEASTSCGEKKIAGHRVDGYVEPCAKFPRGLVIEFNGCYWHAHECRYTDQSVIGNKPAVEIRAKDAKKLKTLKKHHDVKIVWECEVEQERRSNPDMADFFERYEPMDLLHCEKALIGGRTEVFKLHVEDGSMKICFGDIVSLYPTVMKHEEYPIGPPSNVPRSMIMLPMTCRYQLFFKGFVSCRILPPRNLKLPVISIKINGRLFFALCYTCLKEQKQQKCRHTDEERSFNGTFTTVELKKALDLGYTITKVYHAVKYDDWAGNAEANGGLFTSYINEMMVEKIYASGWPSNVETDDEKKAFVAGYLEKEGIELNDWSRFTPRSGARQAAKLLLNSLWGKFAQKVDRSTTEVMQNPAKFWKMFHDTSIVMEDAWCINDAVMVRHRKQEETLKSLKTAAVHIAAYVTSYARLRLYNLMEKAGADNIIYTDTDSVMYAVPQCQVDPLEAEYGPYLGQLTSELKGKMMEFVTIGPKTYSYREVLADGSERIVRKAKGITINSEADKKVTFENMKKMVEEVLEEVSAKTVVQVPQQTVRRDKEFNVSFKSNEKRFRFTFNKRRVLPDGSTLPYGYCDL